MDPGQGAIETQLYPLSPSNVRMVQRENAHLTASVDLDVHARFAALLLAKQGHCLCRFLLWSGCLPADGSIKLRSELCARQGSLCCNMN